MWKISKLAEVSHEMLVFLHPRVSFRVSGFPVASPCLWGKLRTPHSTLYTPHFTLYTPHPTLHSTLPTLHSTLHTLHFPFHNWLKRWDRHFILLHRRMRFPTHSSRMVSMSWKALLAARHCVVTPVLLSRRENSSGAIGLSIDICISYHYRYFNIVILDIRVSIRVRGLHLVFKEQVPLESVRSLFSRIKIFKMLFSVFLVF